MRLITIVALSAILCLSSCSKENKNGIDPEAEENNKNIILKMELPNSTNTRASIETPITNVTALVQTLDIYFYNLASGQVFSVTNLTTAEMTQITSSNGLSFPALNALVDAVAIVANNTEAKDINVAVGGNINELFEKNLDITLEQDFANVTFYGKEETLTGYTPETPTENVDYYYAAITIKPLVSRMEVSGIAIDDIGSIFQSMQLKAVFTDYSYLNIGINTETPVNLFTATPALVELPTSDWWITSGLDQPITVEPFSPETTSGEPGVFVFHFIPSSISPTVRLHLDATLLGSIVENRYVNVRGFKLANGTALTNFEPGNIYKITLPFRELNCTIFEDLTREVTVVVTVQSWTIIDGIVPAL